MITYAQIGAGIKAYLAGACPSIIRLQNYKELTEGMQDTPGIQIYPEACDNVATESGTQFTTFGGGTIQETLIWHVDYYARQRNHLAEDMDTLVKGIDEIHTAMEDAGCPPFGLDGIKSWQWSWLRVEFIYGAIAYVGARFTLRLRTF